MIRLGMLALLLAGQEESPRARELWSKIGPLFSPPPEFKDDLGAFRPVLRFEDGREVKSAADWAERRKELLRKWHDLLGPWPPLLEKPAAQEQWRETVQATVDVLRNDVATRVGVGEKFIRSRIELEVAPGRKSSVYLLTPDGKGPFPAIVDVFYYPEDGAGIKADKRQQNDFGYQAVKRGFVALCLGQNPTSPRQNADLYYPTWDKAQLQPLSYLAYVAANAHTFLSQRPEVDPKRIGVVGHSYGGKWSLFAGALYDKFAAVCVSDPGIVFDEARPNVNYWEPWYLGYAPGTEFRPRGIVTDKNGRTGPYKAMMEKGIDLHELHALVAPRPFFVSGGSEDPPLRWKALNHTVAVNRLLGVEQRVGMSNRPKHAITPEASDQVASFFEYFLAQKKQ
jgi:dienelactone hydrolase